MFWCLKYFLSDHRVSQADLGTDDVDIHMEEAQKDASNSNASSVLQKSTAKSFVTKARCTKVKAFNRKMDVAKTSNWQVVKGNTIHFSDNK